VAEFDPFVGRVRELLADDPDGGAEHRAGLERRELLSDAL
jgi:hypothetical protein